MRRLATLALVLFLGVPQAVAQDDFVAAFEKYRKRIDRPPLTFRLGAMRVLARTRHERALKILATRYARPRVPKDHEQYLLARTMGESFDRPEHADLCWDIARTNKRDSDGWLWFNLVRGEARAEESTRLAGWIEKNSANAYTRAGALEALARVRPTEALHLVPVLLGDRLPSKGMPRTLLVESSAAVLLNAAAERETPAFRAAATVVIDLLDGDDIEDRSRLVIARHLARLFDVERVSLAANDWRAQMAFEARPEEKSSVSAVGRPRFLGVEAAGDRIVYLIDMSDSMLDPLTPDEREAARRISTGAGAQEESLPWDRIVNRFDLAREHLKRSLQGLDENAQFAIIGFGEKAAPFDSTRHLVPANRRSVAVSVAELDAIEPGKAPPDKDRPHGVLWGSTNLHGGLLKAFQMTSRGRVTEQEHVDPATFAYGADTLFVFSDGKPTDDDFAATDMAEAGKSTSDTETGETKEINYRRSASFFGPYRNPSNLLKDVERLNLFRKVEIHVFSMGEADTELLRGIANAGLGRYRTLPGNRVLELDGKSALRVAIAPPPEVFTFECWARPAAGATPAGLGACAAKSPFGIYYRQGAETKGDWSLYRKETDVGLKVLAAEPESEGEWTHLALTYDGKTARLFVGGQPVQEAAAPALPDRWETLLLGAEPNERGGATERFKGAVDEVRVSSVVRYDAAFEPATTFTRDRDTVLLLHLDDDREVRFRDDSGLKGHGTAVGKPRLVRERR